MINHHGSAYALKLDAPFGDSIVDGEWCDRLRFNRLPRSSNNSCAGEEWTQFGGEAGLAKLRALGSFDGEDEQDNW